MPRRHNLDAASIITIEAYCESHEGKNISDAVDSIAKSAFIRPVCRGEVEDIDNELLISLMQI